MSDNPNVAMQGSPEWYVEELRTLADNITGRGVGICNGAAQTIERLRAALQAQASAPGGEVTELLAEAFDAGFSISAEGWNGEYGASTDGRYYLEKRAAALADIAARQQEAARES